METCSKVSLMIGDMIRHWVVRAPAWRASMPPQHYRRLAWHITDEMYRWLADIAAASRECLIEATGTHVPRLLEGDAMLIVEVIEDDLTMRALILEWLADAGYRARVSSRDDVAVKCEADAVVIDLSNQPLQGAATILHARTRFAPAAVIGLSTRLIHASSRDSPQACSLGLDELLPKPCSRQALVAAVERAIAGVR